MGKYGFLNGKRMQVTRPCLVVQVLIADLQDLTSKISTTADRFRELVLQIWRNQIPKSNPRETLVTGWQKITLIMQNMELNSHTERYMIWVIILAAGESRRMGRPKLLLPFGQKTIIETVVDNAVQSKADGVLVVLGSNAENMAEKIRDLPVKTSVNPEFRQGMLSSIQWGFEFLPEDTRAALVMLGDQPMIPSSVIDEVIDAYKRTGKGIVLPVYNKRRGHPILIDMKYRDEVKQISPDTGLRALVHNHADDILEVEVDAPGILKDIDTVEDYSREIKRVAIRGKYDFVRTSSEDFAKRKQQEIDMEEI